MTVKEARQQVGLTQKALSEWLGIPRRTIEDWDSGKSKLKPWIEELLVNKILTFHFEMIDTNQLSKALANFLFREIIEDAHVKYNISQEDMKDMNINSVNRAKVFVDLIGNSKKLLSFSKLYSLGVQAEWDNPEETDYTKSIKENIAYTAKTGKIF